MTIWCGEHRHNTPEGAARCRQKQVDKRIKRLLQYPVQYEPERFAPAVPEQRGPFTVWIFQRGVAR